MQNIIPKELIKHLSGKYRSIIMAIGMFILLDVSILGMNFYTSQAISKDAIGVNLAGRLSTMSQRLIKSLYEVRDNASSAEDSIRPLDELRETYQLFDEAFEAFNKGGTISLADGETVELDPVTSSKSRDALQRINNIWLPFKNLLSPVIGNPEPSSDPFYKESLNDAISFGYSNNITLLNLIAILSNDLEAIATDKAHQLRNIQIIGITLAVINFVIILFHFIAKLRQNDAIIDEARRQNRQIMETVKEGLFLIDKNLVVGSEHSDIMEDFFGISDIQGLTFDGLLEGMVTESTQTTAIEYIHLLFDPTIKENLVKDLNPLDKMEIHTFDKKGRYVTRYLEFSFNRIKEKNAIYDVLVTVNDITRIVNLENDLQLAHQADDTNNNLLATLLPVAPAILAQFLTNTRISVSSINNLLREPSRNDQQHRSKINTLFTQAHKIKGEASALSLTNLVDKAHKLEDILQSLNEQADLNGDDFLPFTIQLNHLIDLLDTVQHFNHQLNQQRKESTNINHSSQESITIIEPLSVQNLAQNIAQEQNKSVSVLCSGLENPSVPESYREVIRESVIQLVRNAVAHGIEPVDSRLLNKKSKQGRVEVLLLQAADNSYELRITDDGNGIDTIRLRQQAINSGKWSEDKLNSWNERKLMSLIFAPGLSTNEQLDHHSGRGIGMDVVRKNILQQGGKIRLSTRTGQYTRFSVNFPPCVMNQHKVA